jgi:transcriptional regulator with GAF, ATPase, and Fis domain
MIRIDHRVVHGDEDRSDFPIPELTKIITADPHLTETLNKLPTYANADLPILLTGEPGTGKELVARAICALGPARRKTCQRLNCSVLTESLAGSELFGHVRGAFTDARQDRPGKFKLAHGANLFLDEVGDLPLSIQPRLLRAVEQGEIEPLGGDRPVEVDVRLIAATNHDLPRLIAQGRFRQDLYDRLAVLAIHLPPLRERPDDILLLAGHFAREAGKRFGRGDCLKFSSGARSRLQKHQWFGNVRELKNVVTRAVLFSKESIIRTEDLSFTPMPAMASKADQDIPEGDSRPSPGRLKELLEAEGGNISAVSRRLQVCSKTIYRWLRSHEIDLMRIRGAAVFESGLGAR